MLSTLVNANEKLNAIDGSGTIDDKKYRSLIGGLLYLSHTCPDIAYGVGMLSRFMSNPSKHHLGAAKRVLKFVAGTMNYGIMYKATDNLQLIGYSDSDWAGCLDDRRSKTGNVFMLGTGPIL